MIRWSVGMLVQIVSALALVLPHSISAAELSCAGGEVACLIDAITRANTTGESDTITLAAGTYTLTTINNTTIDGPNGLPSITTPLTIKSAMAAPTIIERSTVAPNFRLFQVAETGTLSLDGLTLRNGSGAIANLGTVVLTNSTLTGNVHGLGAGISNDGTMTIVNSTLSQGDGLSNDGTLTFTNSTLTGSGDLSNDGTIALTNGTFAGSGNMSNDGTMTFVNSTLFSEGDISNDGRMAFTNSTIVHSGNIGNDGVVTLQNTILIIDIAPDADDCGVPLISLDHNLLHDRPSCRIIPRAADRTGPPGLGPFADDGIPGHGHFPVLPGSPAIDAGDGAVCPPMDQLGHTRVATCDIGAIEFPAALLTLSVNRREVTRGETLILTAILLPWPTPLQGDVYVGVQVPDGRFFFLQQDGSLTTEMRAIVSHATLVPQVVPLFHHRVDGSEPAGLSQWFGVVTAPGTLTAIGGIAQAPFEVLP